MARLRLDRQSQPLFVQALQRLTPDKPPIWGTMNAPQMMAHLTQTIRVSLGELPTQDKSNWLTRNVLIHAFEIMPMPRNFRGPKDFFPAQVSDFEIERGALVDAIGRFIDRSTATPQATGLSPLLGPLTLRKWQRIHAIHAIHHLKQFGVWQA